jgi:hypothetical protein
VWGPHPELSDRLAKVVPASAVALAISPYSLLDNIPAMVRPTGDIMASENIRYKASASPVFKQCSNGKRSRVGVVDAATDDNSARVIVKPIALLVARMVPTSTLSSEEGFEDGDGDGHCHGRHNQVEKKYRDRLNVGFAHLLAAVKSDGVYQWRRHRRRGGRVADPQQTASVELSE